jgi:hypothetical protein
LDFLSVDIRPGEPRFRVRPDTLLIYELEVLR